MDFVQMPISEMQFRMGVATWLMMLYVAQVCDHQVVWLVFFPPLTPPLSKNSYESRCLWNSSQSIVLLSVLDKFLLICRLCGLAELMKRQKP